MRVVGLSRVGVVFLADFLLQFYLADSRAIFFVSSTMHQHLAKYFKPGEILHDPLLRSELSDVPHAIWIH